MIPRGLSALPAVRHLFEGGVGNGLCNLGRVRDADQEVEGTECDTNDCSHALDIMSQRSTWKLENETASDCWLISNKRAYATSKGHRTERKIFEPPLVFPEVALHGLVEIGDTCLKLWTIAQSSTVELQVILPARVH